MAAMRLVLCFLATLSTVYGKFFYDSGTGIYEDGAVIVAQAASSRTLCFDGSLLFYTDGANIMRYNFTSPPSVFVTAEADVDSVSCSCNILAYTYQMGSNTFLTYRPSDKEGIEVVTDLGVNINRVVVDVSKDTGKVIAVGLERMWMFDFDVLGTDPQSFTFQSIGSLPRCIGTYTDGTSTYAFVSFDTERSFLLITVTGETVVISDREVRNQGGLRVRVACLDVSDSQIHFLNRLDNPSDYELATYDIEAWLTSTSVETGGSTQYSATDGDLSGSVTGLAVCGSLCLEDCTTDCDCPSPSCGFCFYGQTGCQCVDAADERCSYADLPTEQECTVPEPHTNAYCIIKSPFAERRSGGAISVVGAVTKDSNITVGRLAKTGRWNTDTLPISEAIDSNSMTPVYYSGFVADVPNSGRGRRFGVYFADISPKDRSEEELIPCIATESSGFFNVLYTITVNIMEDATLTADLSESNSVFLPQIKWDFIGFDSENEPLEPVNLPDCDGSLTCQLLDVTSADQGVYQAFRPRRKLRTWHPIFYLFVRSCSAGMYGPGCARTCGTCIHGVCDDKSGLCTCNAGWSGTQCDTSCGIGQLGQGCGFNCGDIFDGNADCSGLSICTPGKVGCKCYSGFAPPECVEGCPTDYFGPNCETACDVTPCDPRTGELLA